MNNARQFLSNVQGMLLYLKHKNGFVVGLRDLLEQNEHTFQFIYEDYCLNHEVELQKFFKERKVRIKYAIYSSLLNVCQNAEHLTEKGFEEELEKMQIYHDTLIAKLPTKFQELHSFSTVNHLIEELMKAANILKFKIEIKPEIVTVSTDSVNACTLTLETGEPVIFVEEDILSFIHLVSKVFSQCLPFGNEKDDGPFLRATKDEIINLIKENPEILFRFRDFISSYIMEGSPRKSEQYNIPMNTRYVFCTYLMISSEMFLIGHELGHIIAEHNTKKMKIKFLKQENDIVIQDNNWEKEFEADKIGMLLTLQAMALMKFQVDFCYLGIETFFIVQDIALKARKILKDGNEDISNEFKTHPPNLLRRQRIRQELRNVTPDDKEYASAIYMPDVIHETMEYLWENTKEIFYTAYQEKLKQN